MGMTPKSTGELKRNSGVEQRLARLAHNQKVVGSNPTLATNLN